MNDEKYYRRELTKLLMIVKTGDDNSMVSKEYMLEKLNRILSGDGINLHPSLNLAAIHEDNIYYFEIYDKKIENYQDEFSKMRGDIKSIRKEADNFVKQIVEDEKSLDNERKSLRLVMIKEKI